MSSSWLDPVKGIITSHCEQRLNPLTGQTELHNGLDIAVEEGTPVLAVRSGKIIEAGENSGYGKFIKMELDNNYTALFAHLSEILTKEGEYVNKGGVIAKSGNTGASTGPHLHYSLWYGAELINPINFVSFG